jgi:membrane protein DedA with SNARE-associated domain
MKLLKILIFAICLFIYGYSAYKITIEPNHLIWGYICALIFILLFIGIVTIVVEKIKNKEENENK